MNRFGFLLPRYIETERLVLRPWTLDDLEALHEAVQSSLEHLLTFMPWAADEPLSRGKRADLIEGWQRQADTSGSVVYGVFVDRLPIGGTGLHHRARPDELEIGYWIHVDHTRRGYATELTRALIDTAFGEPDIERVAIAHHPDNEISRRIPEGLGFAQDGVDADGHLEWFMTRQQWLTAT